METTLSGYKPSIECRVVVTEAIHIMAQILDVCWYAQLWSNVLYW